MVCIECEALRREQRRTGRAPYGAMTDDEVVEHGLIENCPCECHDVYKLGHGGALARSVRERQPS